MTKPVNDLRDDEFPGVFLAGEAVYAARLGLPYDPYDGSHGPFTQDDVDRARALIRNLCSCWRKEETDRHLALDRERASLPPGTRLIGLDASGGGIWQLAGSV